MDQDSLVELKIRDAVMAGSRPSEIFRQLIFEYRSLTKSDLGTHFHVAFPESDGVVWNMVVHWQEKRKDDNFDMWMDIQLIKELLNANYQVCWSDAWVEGNWQRIKPFVLSG